MTRTTTWRTMMIEWLLIPILLVVAVVFFRLLESWHDIENLDDEDT